MFHLAAFFEAIDNTVNFDVDALSDDVLARTNNHYLLAADMRLELAAVMSATLLRARINAPSLRLISPQYVNPIEVAAAPGDLPNLASWLDNPFVLQAGEEISVEATSGVAMTEPFTALLWLSLGLTPVPSGDIYNARFTSVTAAVANAWTTLTITMEQALPPGNWALVGSELQSTNAQAHRWIIPNQIWRPGVLSKAALGNSNSPIFYQRRLGMFGQFPNTVMPQCQVLCNGADNAHAGFMQLVRL